MDCHPNKFDIILEIPKKKKINKYLKFHFKSLFKYLIILTASSQFCLLYIFVVLEVAIFNYFILTFLFFLPKTNIKYDCD